MDRLFIVTWYYNESKTDFVNFGPFTTYEAAEDWANKADRVGTFEVFRLLSPRNSVGSFGKGTVL